MLTYSEYKEKRQCEFSDLPIFFAFNNDQFEEGMQSLGLSADDTDKIYSLGAGGYFKKTDKPLIDAFFNKTDMLPELMQDHDFCEGAVYHEMCNHEYSINWEGDFDVMSCFGNIEYADDKGLIDYANDLGWTDTQIKALSAAYKRYRKDALDNDWF